MQLDQTDKRIMAILERDGRISAAELGRQIGLSRTAVQDRISRLESNGTITGYHARLSPSADSLIRAVLFVKIAIRPCEKALLWLSGLEGVQEVASLSGDIDAVVRCAVPDVSALTRLNDRIGASELISSSTSGIILRQL
ncbi:Lrp/AsnC family transcriptional regulator [uncultured Cohaesibacter sp.]|uniref:Lrp/AsnC family transcriptional regulator n=1 Tax=uncultured Cohaesibacter sp. TaxID=1002546 RepID=UPI0029C6F228|nr:Lrp/AsnC family transcriptional regulator [uncultured Cohaesibacter sp.]